MVIGGVETRSSCDVVTVSPMSCLYHKMDDFSSSVWPNGFYVIRNNTDYHHTREGDERVKMQCKSFQQRSRLSTSAQRL